MKNVDSALSSDLNALIKRITSYTDERNPLHKALYYNKEKNHLMGHFSQQQYDIQGSELPGNLTFQKKEDGTTYFDICFGNWWEIDPDIIRLTNQINSKNHRIRLSFNSHRLNHDKDVRSNGGNEFFKIGEIPDSLSEMDILAYGIELFYEDEFKDVTAEFIARANEMMDEFEEDTEEQYKRELWTKKYLSEHEKEEDS